MTETSAQTERARPETTKARTKRPKLNQSAHETRTYTPQSRNQHAHTPSREPRTHATKSRTPLLLVVRLNPTVFHGDGGGAVVGAHFLGDAAGAVVRFGEFDEA